MKTLWIMGIIIALLFGYAIGVSHGAGICFDKTIYAANVLLDVELKPDVQNIMRSLPELLARMDVDTKDKLGLLNDTAQKIREVKYEKGW